MRGVEFHDREKEKQEIKDMVGAKPSLITFVYGPINSGNAALITYG
jgi:AAA+ ATPase superfamily predicted ATPase